MAPASDRRERGAELAELAERRERLERELNRLLPELTGQRHLDALTPADLAERLPAEAALVEIVWYGDRRAERATGRYAAFVLRRGAGPVRVELGEDSALDPAVKLWRQALLGWSAALPEGQRRDLERQADEHGAALRRRVWEPLARHLPDGVRTVYLVPDGDLARLPWVALPGSRPGTVLLEDYALSVVPHAPFLLEALREPPTRHSRTGLLAVGGVAYADARAWPALQGSAAEVREVEALAGDRTTVLRGAAATPRRVEEALRGVRYALLSTHAFFDEQRFGEEQQRRERQLRGWVFNPAQPGGAPGLGLRNPLAYSGLVLAGAGGPKSDDPGGAILSGEAIVDLPLEGLLSACDTGLGVRSGDEGVRGLVRAFHLAGCRDVVASLWQVNDEATAALMARLFHGLLKEGKAPLEALRQAQLALYRHPELLPRLAGPERGPPDFAAAVRVDAARPAAGKLPAGLPRRTPPRYWAAFFLSGAGR
jgi:CHAT domain-containing protein